MSSRGLQTAALLASTLTTGLMAGVFGLFAHTIMRGLGRTDDRTFVAAFQSIDRAIINPPFMAAFFGALVLSGAAALAQLGADDRAPLPWVVVACGLYLVTVVITFAVHLPLNDAIKAAGDPAQVDVARVRADFHETRWVAWNVVRTILNTAAFCCLLWALVLHGRATPADASTGTEARTLEVSPAAM